MSKDIQIKVFTFLQLRTQKASNFAGEIRSLAASSDNESPIPKQETSECRTISVSISGSPLLRFLVRRRLRHRRRRFARRVTHRRLSASPRPILRSFWYDLPHSTRVVTLSSKSKVHMFFVLCVAQVL